MTFFNQRAVLRMTLIAAAFAAAYTILPASAAAKAASPTASMSYTHQTAPTQFIEVDGARLAYRRFGHPGRVPLVFLQHFVGNLDSWDPKIIDGFARDREVILFDNAGVGSSSGEVPTTIEGMAKYATGLIKGLGLAKVDLLGFSMGSLVAQQVTIEQPDLVRRLVLVGSGPRGGAGMATLTPEFQAFLGKKRAVPDELLLDVFFTQSATSQAAGRAFLERERARKVNRDADVNDKAASAQVAAFAAWGAPHADANAYLKTIKQPVLVVSGSNDIVHYTVNSFTLEQNLPNAQLIVYPDSNHGSLFQYAELFLKHTNLFLGTAK